MAKKITELTTYTTPQDNDVFAIVDIALSQTKKITWETLKSNILSGTSGQIVFFTGTSSVGGDNALFWDNTNKRLGIGTQTPSEKVEINGNLKAVQFIGTFYDNGTKTTDTTIDWNNGYIQKITLGANITLSFINAIAGKRLILIVQQDSVGNRTLTWPSGTKWENGTTPTLSTSANAIDIFGFFSDGTYYYGSIYGQGFV